MLEIPEWVLKEMHAKVQAEYPNEATGAVLRSSGSDTFYTVVAIANVAKEPRQNYAWSEEETRKLFRRMHQMDCDLLAIYHSHPETTPEPSTTDIGAAWFVGVHYVIFSLAGGKDDLWYRSFLCRSLGDLEQEEVQVL